MLGNLKVGDYVTWTTNAGRSHCAAVDTFTTDGKGVLVQTADRVFELLYWDEIELVTPDLSDVELDWSK